MFGLGMQELMIVFLVVLLLFGGKKIPEIARGLGKGLNEFKKGTQGIHDEMEASLETVKVDVDKTA
jgi:sec-independent protein translocase protein TatA